MRSSKIEERVQPPRSRTLGNLLDEMATRYPEGEAVVFDGDRLTYGEFRARARRLARGLYGLGVRRGDKVALLMGNRTEWLLVDFAVAMLGATLVPVSTWSTARELEYVLRHSDATTLVTVDRFRSQDYLDMLAAIGPGSPRLPLLRAVVALGGKRRDGVTPLADLWELGAVVPDSVIDDAQHAVRPNDIAYILYTSGTTSTPKGVQLEHGGLVANMFNIGERQRLGPVDRLWLGISLFWGFGCENALLAVMTHGGCVVLQEAFEPGEALRLIEQERCTVYYGTPNIALALWEHPDRPRRDLRSLRTGAAIGHPPAIRMVMELGARQICNVYGLTECYGNCSLTDAHDPDDARLHTVGRPLPGFEIRIVDSDTGRPLPPGEIGEIRLRGWVTPGYYKDLDKNAAAFDVDGFFLTGDLGWLDRDGRLRFHGRIKDVVKTGGLNVSPLEVEQILLGHPAIEQAHVVGVPDPRKEEALAAFVVLRKGAKASVEELAVFCRQALAAFKVPQHVRFVPREALPLTASGKVQKHRLRDALAAELRAAPSERRG
jgi:fatty-acyl-CoA synthase